MDKFRTLYDKYINNDNPYIDWNKIELIDDSSFINLDNLPSIDNDKINFINKRVCIIKLNGGLGTTMGCTGPKSLLEIKEGLTFMDIIIHQCKKNPIIPLIFMNSFYTHEQTIDYIKNKNFDDDLNIKTFNQNCYPRILKDTKKPLDNLNDKEFLYPPGHGDLLQSIYDSKILDELIESGIEYAFISNVDNLGAKIDYRIPSILLESNIDFAIELTPKTINDVKGGTLIKYENKYKMFEIAQCPPNKLSEFTSVEKFKYFNTNNIWIKLSSIKKIMESDYMKNIDIIINYKKLKDDRDCIQLEYAIGSMVKFFDNVTCFIVSRERFIPVKTNNDLELIRSDKYIINKETWNFLSKKN